MLEIVVSIVMLTIGALGYAAVTANLARAFLVDSRRARAGDLIHTQREQILQQTCSRATSGKASRFGMPIEWSVGAPGGPTRTLSIVVTRPGSMDIRRDSLNSLVPCS